MKEEQLNQAAADYCHVNLYDNEPFRQDVFEAFRDGMEHTMELPLAERLTESEKEKIRQYRNTYKQAFRSADREDRLERVKCMEVLIVLEAIFDSEVFTDTSE